MITLTLDGRTLLVIGAVLAVVLLASGGRLGCRAASGCLVGLVCIGIGVVLLFVGGWLGG